MMKIECGADEINSLLVTKFFNGNSDFFSLKYKLYYSILRPVLPVKFRQLLQGLYGIRTAYNPNFVYDEILEAIRNSIHYEQMIKNLYPSPFTTAVILTHDVDSIEGFNNIPRILALESKFNLKSSWNIVPHKYKIDRSIINLITETGHEIGIHGYNHDGKLYYSKQIFMQRAYYINKAIEEYGAVGFRSPMAHHNLKWLQELNIEYDASCFDYDPFQPYPHYCGMIWPFIAGKFVELPYTIPQDHTLIYCLNQTDIGIWLKKIDWLLKNHGMILTLTHPDYLINRVTVNMYEKLLERLVGINDAWFCLPREMAEWWKNKNHSGNTTGGKQ